MVGVCKILYLCSNIKKRIKNGGKKTMRELCVSSVILTFMRNYARGFFIYLEKIFFPTFPPLLLILHNEIFII